MAKVIREPLKKGCAKVPVVMQMEALECGAACLTMILAYYSKWIPLEKVRADCGVSRDGSKAKNILRAARSYGLTAKGYRMEVSALKKQATFPCIIHWNMCHFVVLCGFKKNKAIINDPGRGTVAVSMEAFDESFTGVCMLFSPGENFEPSGQPKRMAGFAKARLKGASTAVAFVMLTTVITALIGVIKPAFARIFMDRLLTGHNPDWLLPFTIAFAALAIVELIIAITSASMNLKIYGKLSVCGSTSYMWKVLRMPREFVSQRMAGDLQQRETTNSQISNDLVNTLAPLLMDAVMMVLYLVVMLRYSVPLTALGIAAIAINLVMSRIISKKRINLTRVGSRDAGMLAGATVAGIEMIETIKASGAENGYFEKWAGYQAGVNSQEVKVAKLNQYLGMVPGLVSSITGILVLTLSVWLTMEGQFTVGMVMAFQGIMQSFTSPAQKLITAGQTIQEMRTQMERVEDVMQYPDDVNYVDLEVDDNTEKLSGNIEMKNVSFGYSKLEEPLIRDFNMTLKPGSSVAFVGSSGCGKSTLSKLISGLYLPWSGQILYDGKPIQEIDHSVFTGSLAVVDQDIILFEDTIANNIKMWDESIENFEVIMAARDAQLHEDIMRRDGGYQYKLTEGGKDLSGGQRQRMEIARVLAQDPTIIILDEATSALDAKTEYEVVKSIRARGITCIVVAHRLSTIRDCDEIIVLDHGQVMERGTHQELYANGGLYKQLVTNE